MLDGINFVVKFQTLYLWQLFFVSNTGKKLNQGLRFKKKSSSGRGNTLKTFYNFCIHTYIRDFKIK